MEATRVRLAPLLEWLCAAGFTLAAFTVGVVLMRDGRTVQAVTPVSADGAPPLEAPPVVPSRAVAVPMLPLPDGNVLRLGDRASQILERLGAWAQIGSDSVERVGARERITRFYEYAGSRFALVLEPQRDDEPEVVAIYRQ